MDPISLVFTAYLDSVQSTVNARITETLAMEVKALIMDYQGVRVPFNIKCGGLKTKSARKLSDLTITPIVPSQRRSSFRSCFAAIAKASEYWRWRRPKYALQCGGVISAYDCSYLKQRKSRG